MIRSKSLVLLVPWVIAHGYMIFFLAALIEGSLVSTAAGVASALGYFNIFIIIILSIFGDVFADIFYYWIGYRSRNLKASSVLKYFGVTSLRIQKVKDLLHSHVNKSLLLIKLSPFMGPAGLIIVGAAQVKFKKFFKSILLISIFKGIFFTLIGYFSGFAYLSLSKTIKNTENIAIILLIFIFCIYFIYRRITIHATQDLVK